MAGQTDVAPARLWMPRSPDVIIPGATYPLRMPTLRRPVLESRYPTLNSILRMAFALLFILVRAMYWPIISGRHLWDTFRSIRVSASSRGSRLRAR